MKRRLGLLLHLARRVFGGLVLLVGATFIIYLTVRSAPGDAIDAITPMGTPAELKAQLMAEFGLDRDPLSGYLVWVGQSMFGNFGESLVFSPGEAVMAVAVPAFGRTLALSCIALAVCLLLALLLAEYGGDSDRDSGGVTGPIFVVTAAPSFVVAVCMIQVLNWFVFTYIESGGYVTPPWYPVPIYTDSLMPYVFAGVALLLGDGLFIEYFSSVRAELQRLKRSEFVAAIRSKGASTALHVAMNMLVPMVSGYAARLPLMLGGVVIVEYIFTLDGAGYLLLEAAKVRDFPLVVGLSVLFTTIIVLANVLTDVVRSLVDPREVSRGG